MTCRVKLSGGVPGIWGGGMQLTDPSLDLAQSFLRRPVNLSQNGCFVKNILRLCYPPPHTHTQRRKISKITRDLHRQGFQKYMPQIFDIPRPCSFPSKVADRYPCLSRTTQPTTRGCFSSISPASVNSFPDRSPQGRYLVELYEHHRTTSYVYWPSTYK